MLRLALLASWLAPVSGPVIRPFTPSPDPFAAGLHRGVDLRARPGEAVRSPCAGRVAFSGRTPRGPAVTVRCGGRLATLLPVAPRLRRGRRAHRGTTLGHASGATVHLSARDANGYLDPQGLLRRTAPPAGPAPRPSRRPPSSPAIRLEPPPAAARPPLPWTVWAGLCALALGATGTSARRARGRRRAAPATTPAHGAA